MARVTHRSSSYPAAVSNRGSFGWPAVMPFARGMQPPPQDARKLRHELCRLNWALHCLNNSRAQLVVLLDRKDRQRAELRRQRDEYAMALEAISPELFALTEAERRDYDDPKKALEWAQRREIGGDDV